MGPLLGRYSIYPHDKRPQTDSFGRPAAIVPPCHFGTPNLALELVLFLWGLVVVVLEVHFFLDMVIRGNVGGRSWLS